MRLAEKLDWKGLITMQKAAPMILISYLNEINTGLLQMIIGVLTTCHKQYT
jgi:hypothetical protein